MDYLNNKTRWVVKINDQKTKRVLIEYFPTENKFVYSGQLKINDIWINFSKEEVNILDTNISTIINNVGINILKVYNDLENNVLIYNSFSETMKDYKDIEISDGLELNENNIT